MFAKKNRFSFRESLPKNVFHSHSFTVRFGKNEEGLRVGVVVSKKVDKRAVVRNKIKRRLIEIVQEKLKTNEPFSLVFYIKKQELSSENLENEITGVLNKIKA